MAENTVPSAPPKLRMGFQMTHIELRSVAMWPYDVAENVSYGRKCLLRPKMAIFGRKSLTAEISVTDEFRYSGAVSLQLRCFGKKSLTVTH